MSKRLLAKIEMNGAEYRITHDDKAKRNPYRIVRKWYVPSLGWRSETKERYVDYKSCLYWIAEEANLYGRNHTTG